jgi:hypothetical protein
MFIESVIGSQLPDPWETIRVNAGKKGIHGRRGDPEVYQGIRLLAGTEAAWNYVR